MKTPLLTLSVLLPTLAAAQIHYEVDSINVDPPSPTPGDAITITLHGHFTNSGAYIVYIEPNFIGNTIAIDMSAASVGGTAVLVPHDEVIVIGMLAAGTYAIQVDGAYMVDNAPAPDHVFVVGASTGLATVGSTDAVQVRQEDGHLCATAADGSPLGELRLIDAHGRIVAGRRGVSSTGCLGTSGLSHGPYTLWMRDRGRVEHVMIVRR